MKRFSFMALIATVLCLVACGPKETITPLEGTSDYVMYSKSDAPGKYGIKDIQGLTITPNVYSSLTYAAEHFIGQMDKKYLLLTPENKLVFQSTSAISYHEKAQYFESRTGDILSIYFPQEYGTISGAFENYKLDANGNFMYQEKGKFGVYTKAGKSIIPAHNEMLLLDGEQYIALNSKNAKQPMLNDKGKITNWSRVKITAYAKDGKEVKAPSLAQVKKLVK